MQSNRSGSRGKLYHNTPQKSPKVAEVVCEAFVSVEEGNCLGLNKHRFGPTGLIFGRDEKVA